MASTSSRRSAIVLAVNLTVGLAAVAIPTLSHAAGGGHDAPAASPAQPATVQQVKTVRNQLVRNAGFQSRRKFWTATGYADPRLRVAHPGYRSAHAAQLILTRRGAGDVRERLLSGPVRVNDLYQVTADVKALGPSANVALQLRMYRGTNFVGQRSVPVMLRNHHWNALHLGWVSHVSGVRLTVDVREHTPRAHRGFKVDNVRVIRSRQITVTVPAPTPTPPAGPTPAPTPTPTPTATATTAPSPSPTPTTSATPTADPTPSATATVPAPGPITTASPDCSVSAKLVPSCGSWFGAYKPPSAGENWVTTYTNLESQIGHKLSIVYRYHDMSGAGNSGQFPDAAEKSLGTNHILMFSMASRNFATGAQLQWSDIAAGKYDASVIDPEAARLAAYGKPVFLTFDVEMDGKTRAGIAGTPADYVAAYRHLHDRMVADGATNVIWVWTVTGFSAHDSMFDALYPGNAYVDWIGYDPYNFAACHSTGWKSFTDTIDPFYQWLESNGYGDKPFMLPEYGTVGMSGTPTATADWYKGVPAGLASHPNIKAIMEWDDETGGCNTELTVDPNTEIQAFGTAAKNNYFQSAPATP